jgi:Fe-S cluster assembly protein SufD
MAGWKTRERQLNNTGYASFLAGNDLQQTVAGYDIAMGHTVRQVALDHFLESGVVLAGREAWKYSNIKGVIEGNFSPCETTGRSAEELSSFVPETTGLSMVFVNGIFREEMSNLSNLPAGVRLQTMAKATDSDKFGQLADFKGEPFTALNTALWNDGLYLELDAGTTLNEPVNVINLTDFDAGGSFFAARHLIVAGAGSRASITEYHTSCGQRNQPVLSLPVTEISCGEDSHINHLKIVQENESMYHLGSTHVLQSKDSQFSSQEFALNGASVRRELHLQLNGEGASCDLKALSMGRGTQQVDMRTRIDHLVPGCNTNELYKGILDDKSRGIFDGLIKVVRDAQQTSAHQTNRTLVLSDDAVAYSIPRLEIYADDVKCSHGSTTGQLEDEQIFFLRSRGFTEEKARSMLAAAFAHEVVLSVVDPLWRKILDLEIAGRLATPSRLESA